MEKFRSRKMCMLLYPNEDETHRKALEYIRLNYDYASIVHDKDVNIETGEIKKEHTHVVVSFSNAKWNTAFAEEIGITENYIQSIRSFESCLEYLIHYNDDTKYQYDIEEVQGSLKNKLKKFVINDNKDENEKCLELIEYIDSYYGYLSIKDFSLYCCSVGMWDMFRRASGIYLSIIQEHNSKCSR